MESPRPAAVCPFHLTGPAESLLLWSVPVQLPGDSYLALCRGRLGLHREHAPASASAVPRSVSRAGLGWGLLPSLSACPGGRRWVGDHLNSPAGLQPRPDARGVAVAVASSG